MTTLPHPALSLITESESVSPEVTNRPMIQLMDNIQSVASTLESMTIPSTDAPINPTLGLTYTDLSGNILKWNGTFWEPVSGVIISPTQPTKGREGLFWWDSSDDLLYIHNGMYYAPYNSGVGSGGGTTSGYLPVVPLSYDITLVGGETSVPFTYTADDTLMIYINNMIADIGKDYTLSVSAINFSDALSVDTNLKVVKYTTGSVTVNLGVTPTTIGVAIAGNTFPYVHTAGETEIVFLDGAIVSDADYMMSGTNLVFNYEVSALSEIKILKMSPTAASTILSDADAILQFDSIYLAV